MITTSTAWDRYTADSTVFYPKIICKKNGSTIHTFEADHIASGSVFFTDDICQPGEFNIGSTISNQFGADILNYDSSFPSPSTLNGAEAELWFYMPGTNDGIRRGIYILDPIKTVGEIVHIGGYDYMNDIDKNKANLNSYDFTGKTFATVLSDLGYSVSTFPGSTNVFPTVKATKSYGLDTATKRDVLEWICQICGCYARYNNNGVLQIKRFGIAFPR